MSFNNAVLLLATIATALIAGLFYGWSVAVAPGLGKLGDREYLGAMQSLNAAIQNPLFFLSFMGAAILLPLSAVLQGREAFSTRFWLLAAAAAVYILGVFAVTAAGNVPLNNGLAAFRLDGASAEEMRRQRVLFEGLWNRLHTVRTFAVISALVLAVLACMSGNDGAVKKP